MLGGRNGRDRQAETGKRHQVDGSEQIDDPHIAYRQQPVDKPGDTGAYREQDKTDNPERYQFGEQKQGLRDRCHVDLFDRSLLLFAHDVQGGKETADKRQQEGHDTGNHIVFITQMRIEQVCDTDSALSGRYGRELLLLIEILDDGREV